MRRGGPALVAPGLVLALWGLPLAAAMALFLASAADVAAWRELLRHPQLAGALALSLWTGTAAALLALMGAILVAMAIHGTAVWRLLQAAAGAALAIPHLAFAIGFGFLLMPSGILARLVVGGAAPPQWVTTQDPLGLSLIACLALKEAPFLLAMLWAALARGDAGATLAAHGCIARSLGHGGLSIWLRVLLPQLLPRLLAPLAVVWVYGSTAIDVALVIGPTQPPTLAVLAWTDLNHAETGVNARGLAAAALLTVALAAVAGLLVLLGRLLRPWVRQRLAAGPSARVTPRLPGQLLLWSLVAVYAAVFPVLVAMSLAGRWPYPDLMPLQFTTAAWRRLWMAPQPALLSLSLALSAALAAVALAVLWCETVAQRVDRLLLFAAVACLALPPLVVAGGYYRLFLATGLAATLAGLWLAHFAFVFAYVVVVLVGPYRAFDRRWQSVAAGLGVASPAFWWRVKAPVLKAPLLLAIAVGFAVGIVQFEAAQLVAAGRFATLPMEAVTLAAGGSRSLAASHALALAILPAALFWLSQWLSRARWEPAWT